jgi:hypothetical protein
VSGGEITPIAGWGDARGAMSTAEDSMAFAEVEGDTARLRVTSLTSGEPVTIATVAPPVYAMHHDGECVYFGRAGEVDPGLFVVAAPDFAFSR